MSVAPTEGSAPRGGGRRPFFRRRKSCPFSGANAPKIDYKDIKLLQRFVSERGKIVPSRITAVSAEVSPATVPQPRPARQSGSGARYKSTPARAVAVEAEAISAAATRPDPAPMMSGVGIVALSRLQAVRGGKSPAPTSIQASNLALASY